MNTLIAEVNSRLTAYIREEQQPELFVLQHPP